jgi:hypothetical protein
MTDSIEIRAKTKSGTIQAFQVVEIVSIDGKPYLPAEGTEELKQHLIHLDGRLTAIERIVGGGNAGGE